MGFGTLAAARTDCASMTRGTGRCARLTRLELINEAVRAALEELAGTAPHLLVGLRRVAPPEPVAGRGITLSSASDRLPELPGPTRDPRLKSWRASEAANDSYKIPDRVKSASPRQRPGTGRTSASERHWPDWKAPSSWKRSSPGCPTCACTAPRCSGSAASISAVSHDWTSRSRPPSPITTVVSLRLPVPDRSAARLASPAQGLARTGVRPWCHQFAWP